MDVETRLRLESLETYLDQAVEKEREEKKKENTM